MAYQAEAAQGLDYDLCQYGASRTVFRGPYRGTMDIAFLGGIETFGRFVPHPFPALLEDTLGVPCANLGVPNAGLDCFIKDPAILQISAQARVKVIQILGAHNLSNRYYQVHARRNDRFLQAANSLVELYPETDFTEFHFTRHMLNHLLEVSEEQFRVVVAELRAAWVARMKSLITRLGPGVVLIWIARSPIARPSRTCLVEEPLFVSRKMVEALRPRVAGLVEVTPSQDALAAGTDGMVFAPQQEATAAEVCNPSTHQEICEALRLVIDPLLRRSAA